MMFKRQSDTKYKHIVTEQKVVLGIDKGMSDEDVSLLSINPMQTFGNGLLIEIMKANISIRDRSILISAVEDYASIVRNSKCFNGRYWDILLDFFYAVYDKTLYDLATEMTSIYPNYEAKNIYDTLDKLKTSKGNPRDFSKELVKVLCCYCRVSEEVLSTGKGYLYMFEETDRYSLEKVYQYCNNHTEINLKDMIKNIACVKDDEIIEVPLQIGIEVNSVDKSVEEIVKVILEKMCESGA